jgi:hypothetical protein
MEGAVASRQLVAKEGQVFFDSFSLRGRHRLRQLNLTGSDQVFDDLAGWTHLVEVGRGQRFLGYPQLVDRGPSQDRDHDVLLTHLTRQRQAGNA